MSRLTRVTDEQLGMMSAEECHDPPGEHGLRGARHRQVCGHHRGHRDAQRKRAVEGSPGGRVMEGRLKAELERNEERGGVYSRVASDGRRDGEPALKRLR